MSNPETIEIHGLSTIHKLCKFGADNNMEGCSFTEIVERMFAELAKSQAVPEKTCSIQGHEIIINETKNELINDYDIAKEDEYLLEALVYRGVCIGKSQAVPEGRTDIQIIEQTIGIVRLIGESNSFECANSKVFPFESKSPRLQVWWRVACEIQELLTDTDPNNCDFEEYKAMVEAQEQSHDSQNS